MESLNSGNELQSRLALGKLTLVKMSQGKEYDIQKILKAGQGKRQSYTSTLVVGPKQSKLTITLWAKVHKTHLIVGQAPDSPLKIDFAVGTIVKSAAFELSIVDEVSKQQIIWDVM